MSDTRRNWNQVTPVWIDRSCDICGSDDSTELLGLHGTAYHECAACKMIYARPVAANLTAINEDNYSENLGKFARKLDRQRATNRKRVKAFESYRQTGRFLELGCNAGIVVAAAQELGWDAKGVDISEAATQFARDELGLDVFTGTLDEAQYPEDYFDVVYNNSVMEHLEHPMSALTESLRILRPGGVFYADTVNWDSYTRRILREHWRYIDPIDHVHLYTPENVANMAKRAGFEIDRIWSNGARVEANQPGSTYVAPWYLSMSKGLLSIGARMFNKGDTIKFRLRKPT